MAREVTSGCRQQSAIHRFDAPIIWPDMLKPNVFERWSNWICRPWGCLRCARTIVHAPSP